LSFGSGLQRDVRALVPETIIEVRFAHAVIGSQSPFSR
jgi:hypothetical protein